ncbi:hypothetical protein [Cellvibrio mixtus]|uniref:hypothetical protein n=1 Tax=Cellvibrio mixtus TaxID=39650 RepID=UPI0005877069|nr:hypothetical protein [Cellvibrio mixtus]
MNSDIFNAAVLKHFNFLTIDYGFSVVQKDSYQIRFESDQVFLSVYYDANRSYELDVEIGLLSALFNVNERSFNLGELLRTENAIEGKQYRTFQVSSPDAIERCVSKLATLVLLNAKDYLLGNKFSFKRISDLRNSECTQLEMKRKLDDVRSEAQAAWQKKEYSKVVALYKPVEHMLSEVERKKLVFAQRHSE